MEHRPRIDCSDVPHDSDDHWLTLPGLHQRVDEILRDHESTTAGLAETPLGLSPAVINRRLARWEPRLVHLGRIQTTAEGRVFHWMTAELIAHEALHELWSQAVVWPLGWWPWVDGSTPPELPDHLVSPQPFTSDE